jgi:hypothetical protein
MDDICNKDIAMRLILPTALLTAASSAPGAMIIFDIPDLIVSDNQLGYNGLNIDSLNLADGSFTTSTFSTPVYSSPPPVGSFSFGTYNYSTPGQPNVFFRLGYNTIVNPGAVQGGGALNFLAPGSVVSNESLGFSGFPTSIGSVSESTSGTRYIGLRLLGNDADYFGWLEVSYSARVDGVRNYTFTRFAFEGTAFQAITTPTAIPEASTLGLVGGLFGLVAAAHVRRRKLKQAAASDKFLALAAGEKLN